MADNISIEIHDALYRLLVNRAKQAGLQPESLTAEWPAAAAEHTAHNDPLEAFTGAFETGVSDRTSKQDKHLGCGLSDDHTPESTGRGD